MEDAFLQRRMQLPGMSLFLFLWSIKEDLTDAVDRDPDVLFHDQEKLSLLTSLLVKPYKTLAKLWLEAKSDLEIEDLANEYASEFITYLTGLDENVGAGILLAEIPGEHQSTLPQITGRPTSQR